MGALAKADYELDKPNRDQPAGSGRRDLLEAVRYEHLRRALVSEICSAPADPAQVAAVLAFTHHYAASPLMEFAFADHALAAWAGEVVSHLARVDLRQPQRRGGLTHLVVAELTLARARVAYRRGRWYPAEAGASTDRAVIRGAMAAAGFLTPVGLIFMTPFDTARPVLAAALRRARVPLRVSGATVTVPAEAACKLLMWIGLPAVAHAYVRALRSAETGVATSEVDRVVTNWAQQRLDATGHAADGPATEGVRLAALGDLSRYRLEPQQRQVVGALVTDRRRSYDDIAVSIGITPAALQRLLNNLWSIVTGGGCGRSLAAVSPTGTPWPKEYNDARAYRAATAEAVEIAALGDLADQHVSAVLRQAAEYRRDNPNMSLLELAESLGVTKDTYAGRLRRFWKAIRKEAGRPADANAAAVPAAAETVRSGQMR
ncbi:helix-turn-helix domain-containing protein [Mycobacterium sp. 134]|uniref:helix-turn-helix domain-containing protein n=1 Tax=Mycobacterium sp. 134 TaxID=3400425 RepID=UPI003AACEAC5